METNLTTEYEIAGKSDKGR